jgi:hypothetical protein
MEGIQGDLPETGSAAREFIGFLRDHRFARVHGKIEGKRLVEPEGRGILPQGLGAHELGGDPPEDHIIRFAQSIIELSLVFPFGGLVDLARAQTILVSLEGYGGVIVENPFFQGAGRGDDLEDRCCRIGGPIPDCPIPGPVAGVFRQGQDLSRFWFQCHEGAERRFVGAKDLFHGSL